MKKSSIALLCLIASLLPAPAPGQTVSPAGQRYANGLLGFSITPPAGSAVLRRFRPGELVRFVQVDAKTKQARATISLRLVWEKKQIITDLADYGLKLADHLAATDAFKVEPDGGVRRIAVAGKPALDLQGYVGGAAGSFRRDVWVMQGPDQFLVLQADGAAENREEILRVSQASLATLDLVDPMAVLEAQKQALDRGTALLKGLTPAAVDAAIAKAERWFAILQGERMAGFMQVVEQPAQRKGAQGVQVNLRMVMVDPKGVKLFTNQELYSSADLGFSRWETVSLVKEGATEKGREHQFGTKTNEALVVQRVIGQHEIESRNHKVPEDCYVPLAMAQLLPRLLDRRTPGNYDFAQYNPTTSDVEIRSLRVVGPEKLALGGRSYDAVLLTDRMAADMPEMKVYVDAAGMPLKIISPDDSGAVTVYQQTTAEAILARFAAEWKEFPPPSP